MFTSAELIEALRRRMRRSLRPLPPPGEFPPAWRDWFASMAARPGPVVGASADELLAVLSAREPALPPGSVERLGRWRAFTTLWRQDWQPASRDERWTRIAATSGSLLLHLLFVVALVWLMFASFHVPGSVDDAREGQEHVLQVEYIGENAPVEAGGGAAVAPIEQAVEPAPAASARVARATPREVAPAETPPDLPAEEAPVAPPPLPEREIVLDLPEMAPPTVATPDVLQVTEVEVPDSDFVLPPPRELSVQAPAAPAPDVAVRSRDIEVQAPATVEVPRNPVTRAVDVAVPQSSPRGVAMAEREIELAEAPGVTLRASTGLAPIRTTGMTATAPAVRERGVPMPAEPAAGEGASAADRGRASASASDRATGTDAADGRSAAAGGRPAAGPGARASGAPAPGAGQQAGRPPGTVPSAGTSDDWGDSTRNVPGRQAGTPGASGLFNADGSPRLAAGDRVGGGLPPGTITEDFENIDRHGTWLKRPPYDYEPTSFDRFWMPSESLLEEWVRRSVTEVRIPIPGTTKTIRCVTVMLALGGGCDIVDPNLQEQPAAARPPPDIPFKRELQEDQDSLGPPPQP
ncbi:hypothetical protein WCE39_04590 [Luteimonas sp. MJ174]|uniref:hypothetical protein n=1 Tax=Luteimonas sp. MJ174 TaxID=3129237 RepID=UPI0031B9BE0F